jgi:GNAT superfamily N-acetyltransferase
MEWKFGDYIISTDKSLLSIQKVSEFLHKSYWASERPVETIERSINNSLCYGIYLNNDQVGFARVVSDYATVYWVCDVYMDENHRGKGIGKELIKCIVGTDELKGIRGILATKDAHGLYQKYGFEKAAEGRFMLRPGY